MIWICLDFMKMSENCEQIRVFLWELHIATATRFYALACILIPFKKIMRVDISYGLNNLLCDKHSNESSTGGFTKEQSKRNCILHQILLYFAVRGDFKDCMGSNNNGLIQGNRTIIHSQ